MNLAEVRDQFPYLDDGRIYFNHASLGPLSQRVKSRILEFVEQRSTGPIDNFPSLMKSSVSAKLQLSKLLNCPSERLAWVDNVSNAFNILARGLQLKKDDRIILFENEFPSNVYPFMNLRAKGIHMDFVKTRDQKIIIEDIAEKITPRTKLLSVSLVQFLSGFRADMNAIGKLCKENDIVFSVDAIQGAGVVGIDIQKSGIDFLVGGSQKWLMALQGTSYFYISKKTQQRLVQENVGWTSVKDAWNLTDYNLELKENADSFQNGTMNSIGITALDESLKLFHEFGLQNIESRILDNTQYFRNKLIAEGFDLLLTDVTANQLSGITTVKTPKPDETFDELKNRNIVCSLREGYLRFAPHFYNTEEEIDKVVTTLKSIVRK